MWERKGALEKLHLKCAVMATTAQYFIVMETGNVWTVGLECVGAGRLHKDVCNI